MFVNKRSENYLIIFVHVEKCGGTSLLSSSRRRKGLKHCDIISSRKFGNVASESDFGRSLGMYRNCDFITGHCLYPKYLAEYKNIAISKGYKPIVITSIRNPVDRLLSDYAHARRRGEVLGLDQFIDIPFKKNYICNFWGGGGFDAALARLSSIDYVIRVGDFEEFVRFVNMNYKLGLCQAAHSNSSRVEDLPSDLVLDGGVSVGKYSIDQDIYNKILEYNQDDIKLLKRINYWTPDASDSTSTVVEIDIVKTKQVWAWLYRNLWYKPRMQQSIGRLHEKRNGVPHRLDEDVNFMWGD